VEGILAKVSGVIADRLANPVEGSYVCRLLQGGEDAVLRKIGEEAVETILAAKSEGDERVVKEAADLVFHLLVPFGSRGIPLERLFEELEARSGKPGGNQK